MEKLNAPCPGCALLAFRLAELEKRHTELRDSTVQRLNRLSAAVGRIDMEAQTEIEWLKVRLDKIGEAVAEVPASDNPPATIPTPLFPDEEQGPYREAM